eukprot:gene17100-20326_t
MPSPPTFPGIDGYRGPNINPATGKPYESRFKKDYENAQTEIESLKGSLKELQQQVIALNGKLLEAKAETAEARRAAEYEKKLAEAIQKATGDSSLARLGGAFAVAANTDGMEKTPDERAVHFAEKKRKKEKAVKARKKRDGKGDGRKKKARRDFSSSESDVSDVSGTSGSTSEETS